MASAPQASDHRALWIAEVADQRRRASARAQRPYDPREHDVVDPYFPASPWLVSEQQAASSAKRLHDSVNDQQSIEMGDGAALKRLQEKLSLLEKYQPNSAKDEKQTLTDLIRLGDERRKARKTYEKAKVSAKLESMSSTQMCQSIADSPASILRKGPSDSATKQTHCISFASNEPSSSPRSLARSRSPVIALVRPRGETDAKQKNRRCRFPLDAVGDEARAQQVTRVSFS